MAMLRQPAPDKAYPSGDDVAKESAGDKVAGNPVLDALQTLGMYAASLRDKGNPAAAEAFKGFLEAIKGGGEGAAAGPEQSVMPPSAGQPGPREPSGPEEGAGMPEEEEEPDDEEEASEGGMKPKMRGRGMRGPAMAPKGFRKETTVL